MAPVSLSVGIAGAGIAGLAAGAFLARAGHNVTLFDQFERPAPVGSGLMIQPIGLAVLDALGAGAGLRAHGAPIRRILGRLAGSGRTVLDVSYADRGSASTGYAVQRATLFEVLLQAAERAGVHLRPGHRVEGTEPTGAGLHLLAAEKAHGPFDVVIDALGQRSVLCPRPGRLLPYGALWCLVEAGAPGFAPDRLEQRYVAARRMTGVLPVGTRPGDDRPMLTFFWSLPARDHATWEQAPISDWHAAVAADWPETAPLLDQITEHGHLSFARYRHRTLSSPVSGRIAHLGDSYHSASPQLGQGANMALLDAAALASALATETEPDAALARYARLRRLHVSLYTAASWMFTPVYQSDSRILPVLRDRLLAPLSRVPPMPRILGHLVAGEIAWPRRGLGPVLGAAQPLADGSSSSTI
ncbi:MAG: NAD(P)/FAD-dependent oxidoreductase [Pseudomonadota bacterium]